MNVGEMQRMLSTKAERSPEHRFDDLYNMTGIGFDWRTTTSHRMLGAQQQAVTA
jgi:hypothetical protein